MAHIKYTAVAAWISGQSLPQSPWISGFQGFKNICKISWTPCITDGGLFSKHHTTQYKGHLVTLHRFGCRLSAERAWITPTPSRPTYHLSLKKTVTANPKLWFSLRLAYTQKKGGELEDGLHKDQLNLANSEQCIKFGHLLRPAAMSNPSVKPSIRLPRFTCLCHAPEEIGTHPRWSHNVNSELHRFKTSHH